MKIRKFYVILFLCVITFLMFSSFYAAARRKVEIEQWQRSEIIIDWEKIYPFEDKKPDETENEISTLQKNILYLKEKITNYTSEKYPGYYQIVEAARKYEDILSWNMTTISEYNPVITLSDGYLSGLTASGDVSESIKSTVEFSGWCEENGIKFLYINLPAKICVSQDRNISGIFDFSNQNADRFLRGLEANNVKFYDLRKFLHDEGINHHEAFFRTDHHWKLETGLWAAKHILEFLRDDYNWNVNSETLNPQNFERVVYHGSMLGTEGKKLTLARCTPDDVTRLSPKFYTNLNFENPPTPVKLSTDFSCFYGTGNIDSKDLYGIEQVRAPNDNSRAFKRVKNNLAANDKKLMLVRDSFSDSLIPFISLEIKDIEAIDLRDFQGSLKTCIKSFKPDVLIVIYYSKVPGRRDSKAVDASERDKKFYDFR